MHGPTRAARWNVAVDDALGSARRARRVTDLRRRALVEHGPGEVARLVGEQRLVVERSLWRLSTVGHHHHVSAPRARLAGTILAQPAMLL